MKINVTCSGCQRVMRIGEQHIGKKGKCPSCGTVNPIQPDPELASNEPPKRGQASPSNQDDIPDAIPIQAPSSAPAPKKDNSFSLSSADFNSPNAVPNSDSPYQAPNQTGGPMLGEEAPSDPDVPGILGVVAGGLSLLGLTLCLCFGPIVVGVVLLSIAGLIVSCFGRPPLKAIGIGLNLAALVITLLIIVAGVAFFFFAVQQQPGGINGF